MEQKYHLRQLGGPGGLSKTKAEWRSLCLNDFQLPENAEGSLLGCVLLCPDTKPVVSRLISASDFASPLYAAAFSAAMELNEADSVQFKEAVKARGFDLPDGFFRALTDISISRSNAELYAQLLRKDSIRRQLGALAAEISRAVNDQHDGQEIIATTAARLKEIEQRDIARDLASPADAVNAFWDHRQLVEDRL